MKHRSRGEVTRLVAAALFAAAFAWVNWMYGGPS